jgi:hypothetical protein
MGQRMRRRRLVPEPTQQDERRQHDHHAHRNPHVPAPDPHHRRFLSWLNRTSHEVDTHVVNACPIELDRELGTFRTSDFDFDGDFDFDAEP